MASKLAEPTAKQHDKLVKLIRTGAGIRKIASELGVGRTIARRWREEVAGTSAREPDVSRVPDVAEPVAQSGRPDEEQALKRKVESALRAHARYNLEKITQKRDWSPDVDGPIGIAVLADIHWGSDFVDYDALDRDIETIRETEGLYVLLGGDAIDNSIKHLASIISQNMPPSFQWEWYGELIKRLAPKLVGVVGGNHEAWTFLLTGYDPLKQISRMQDVLYDPDELAMQIHVGEQSYRWLLRHKYRYNSTLNASNSVKRMYDMHAHFDVGVVCDKHEYTCESFSRDNTMRWAVRPGSYQITSGFARGRGFQNATPVSPVMVMCPDRRNFHGFQTVEWGATALTAMREEWKSRR